jgi:hypothetical protein
VEQEALLQGRQRQDLLAASGELLLQAARALPSLKVRSEQVRTRAKARWLSCRPSGTATVASAVTLLVLEHMLRGVMTRPALRARLTSLDGADAVAAQVEEVVVDAHLREAQDLGKERHQDFFLRRARRADALRREVRRGQGLAVELAVGVRGSASSTTMAAGTM